MFDFCFFVLVSFCFLWKSLFSLQFYEKWISVSHFSFWFLLFVIVCLLFWGEDALLFLFFCLFSYFVLNHNITFCFASCFLVVVFCFCCCGICYFLNFGYLSKTSLGNLEIPKNAGKKQTLWQEQLAQVCSQIVFLFFVCVWDLHVLLRAQ